MEVNGQESFKGGKREKKDRKEDQRNGRTSAKESRDRKTIGTKLELYQEYKF